MRLSLNKNGKSAKYYWIYDYSITGLVLLMKKSWRSSKVYLKPLNLYPRVTFINSRASILLSLKHQALDPFLESVIYLLYLLRLNLALSWRNNFPLSIFDWSISLWALLITISLFLKDLFEVIYFEFWKSSVMFLFPFLVLFLPDLEVLNLYKLARSSLLRKKLPVFLVAIDWRPSTIFECSAILEDDFNYFDVWKEEDIEEWFSTWSDYNLCLVCYC